MKLWLVLLIAGHIEVTWRLPDGATMPQCQAIAVDQKAAADENKTVAGVDAKDMEFRCEWHARGIMPADAERK